MSAPPPASDTGSLLEGISLRKEMEHSYLDYAMSVIVARALPDVRDGLKPVHRRILFAMKEGGYESHKPYRKSSRIVGDVMGKYHPHGDVAIYEAMVRMAQPFSLRLPLVDGQGNFGSMDGDSPAAMRYTEARMGKASDSLLMDIDKETVDFVPNYDEALMEPSVLPARFPNLLVNGAGGIAVGMATNIAPHNLGELVDACCALIENPDLTDEDLLGTYVLGPDFPTGGLILGREGIRAAFTKGRGSIVMRARTNFEEISPTQSRIVVTEIPYQVNKASMIEKVAELVRDKKIEGISDIRDESDRQGVRVVFDLKRGVMAEVVLNHLFRLTPLQTNFSVNSLALVDGRPKTLSVKEILAAFLRFREEVITRRTVFDLNKARQKAHIQMGLAIAVENVDDIIALIRHAASTEDAHRALLAKSWPMGSASGLLKLLEDPLLRLDDSGNFFFSEEQSRAILALRLHRLTGMERDKIATDLQTLGTEIKGYLQLLSSRLELLALIREDLLVVKGLLATPRRTEIIDDAGSQEEEDFIQREDVVITLTRNGYIKRVPVTTYKEQKRGGKGRNSMTTHEEDALLDVFITHTHTSLLFFSSRGLVYKLKAFKIPTQSPTSVGKHMANLLNLRAAETITTVLPFPKDVEDNKKFFLFFVTRKGYVRRNLPSDFAAIKAAGKIAMKLDEDDSLVGVHFCTEDDDIFLASRLGTCVRFPVTDVRLFKGRGSVGVRGISLRAGDTIVSAAPLHHAAETTEKREAYLQWKKAAPASIKGPQGEIFLRMRDGEQEILTITERGFAKRSSSYEYRTTRRAGKGIRNLSLTDRNGAVVGSFVVMKDDNLLVVSSAGQIIRCGIDTIRVAGRVTQGVKVFRISAAEKVVSATVIRESSLEAPESLKDSAPNLLEPS